MAPMLFLPARLKWAIQNSAASEVLVAAIVAATQRYSDIIFAWGAPVPPSSGAALLTHVNLQVDNPDDSFTTLQLGMDERYTLDVPTNGTATIHAAAVWGALRALETLAQMSEYHPVSDHH